ncbi:hypothetical protein FGG08_004331 [Glutinoglossum americanum]|uniref:Uncharacterized protein n=1 Tax=Glutinoglossum americanum TaxID=1670608 RepID=A0A9P8I7Q9_9PEZI|nr:hypothetical protein FGG08_004331 [Glutinoglossum americanum]
MAQEIAQPGEKRSREQMNERTSSPDVQIIERPAPPPTLLRPSRSISPLKSGRKSPKMTNVKSGSSSQGPTRDTPREQTYTPEESSFARSPEDSILLESHPKHPIESFDWDEFEGRFADAMGEIKAKEDLLYDEFDEMIQFFGIWLSTIDTHEDERAHKRLKTRIHWVQGSESNLEEKRGHYMRVVEAFQRALALLGDT